MKLTSTAVHGSLAAAAIIAAYVTWQREPENKSEAVIVLDAARKDLVSVRYDDPSKFIELRPTEDGEGVWVKVGQKESPDAGTASTDAGMAAPDAGATRADGGIDGGAASPTPPPEKTPDRELRGNEFAEKLFKRFAPLRAARALGVIEETKLAELGLKAPTRVIEVKTRSQTLEFDIGASGLGLMSPYLRGPDGKVYLLGGGIVTELDMGQGRLVDRELHDFSSADFDEIKVTVGAQSRSFVVMRGATPAQNKLAAKETPQTPDDFVKNWHDKVWRTYAIELLGRGEEPKQKPVNAFRIDYLRQGEAIGFFDFSLVGEALYVKTEHSAGWVRAQPGGEGLHIEAARVVAPDRK